MQLLDVHRQFSAAYFAIQHAQVAVDLRCQQPARQCARAIQLPGDTLDHRYKRAGQGQVQAIQAEAARQRLARRARIQLSLQRQLANGWATQLQQAIDALRAQLCTQAQAVVGKLQPLLLITNAPDAAAGIQFQAAIRTAGRHIELQPTIELTLPAEILRPQRRQALHGEVAQLVVELGLRQQALLRAAQTGLARTPAMRAQAELPIGQPHQRGRLLQAPILATALHLATTQAAAPVTLVQLAGQGQLALQQGTLQLQLKTLLLLITSGSDIQAPQLGFTQLNTQCLQGDSATLGTVQAGVELELLQTLIVIGQALTLQLQLALGGL